MPPPNCRRNSGTPFASCSGVASQGFLVEADACPAKGGLIPNACQRIKMLARIFCAFKDVRRDQPLAQCIAQLGA